MIALFVLLFFAVWIPTAWWLASLLRTRLGATRHPRLLMAGCFAATLMLPVADEIVGAVQFYAICEAHSGLDANPSAALSTRAVSEVVSSEVHWTILPVTLDRRTYRDASSGKEIIGYDVLLAGGGLLAKLRGSGRPLLFPQTCNDINYSVVAKRLREMRIYEVRLQ